MKDRRSKHPGRVKLTPVDGMAYTYDMERADEPEEAGTPINKQSLLTDETATEIGLQPGDNPTPNDAMYHLALYTAAKEGDIRETVRTDLGDRWLLCNGDVVPEGEYPKLQEVLPYNTAWRRFGQFVSAAQVRPLPQDGKYFLWDGDNSEYKTHQEAIYDAKTDTITEFTSPINGAVFGLTNDGTRYIIGIKISDEVESGQCTVHLLTSTDLAVWEEKLQYTLSGYEKAHDLTFVGDEILMATEYYYYYSDTNNGRNDYIYRIDKNLSSMNKITGIGFSPDSTLYFRILPKGKFAFTNDYDTSFEAYDPSTMNRISIPYSGRAAFFNERYWVGVPNKNQSPSSSYFYVYDFEEGTYKSVYCNNIVPESGSWYLYGAEYDRNTNKWALYIGSMSSSSIRKHYIAYISADADPTDTTQYRAVRIEAFPETLSREQMTPDKAQLNGEYIRDPNLKYLPSHDGDTLKYIYTG